MEWFEGGAERGFVSAWVLYALFIAPRHFQIGCMMLILAQCWEKKKRGEA
jgi:hypothetical protein